MFLTLTVISIFMNKWDLTETELFPFFEMTPDLVCIAGKDGYFKKVNRAVVEKFQYSLEELYSRPIESFMHPEDKTFTLRERSRLLQGTSLKNLENRYVTKNNEVLWLNWTSVYLADKEVVFAIAKDITQRKVMELEKEANYQKFKSLALSFKDNMERDRKHLAYNLHEQVAQLASVIKMDIEWLSDHLPALDALAVQRMKNVNTASNALVDMIRDLSFALSPVMLDDLGLNETLEGLCKDFSKVNGIPCRFETNFEDDFLSREARLDLFRVCQEALDNVKKHSGASSVHISLMAMGAVIKLIIADDGSGFDVEKVENGKGINTMLNRVASLYGKIFFEKNIDTGTMITVEVERKGA
jgi:PAS domain S-box-containing protein